MWRRWSAPVLKVICACFTPTGIHYLHSCSPKAQGTTGSVDEKSPSQSWSNTYLYRTAQWVRSTQCQDYHSLPGNFIIICTSCCGCVTMQVAVPVKSKVHQHCSLHAAIFLENNCHNKCDITQLLCVLKLIYANNAYLVNVSKIRHPLGICTAMNTVINVRALRCRDFIASSP